MGPDYHVEVDRHYYSVPYTLVGRRLEVRLTARVVEVFLRDRRVGSHARRFDPGRHTTLDEHMPPAHRAYLEWTPERIRRWVGRCGPEAAAAGRARSWPPAIIRSRAFAPAWG